MAQALKPRQAVYAHLRADPSVTVLVGSRIYHRTPPLDATYPLITINTINNNDIRDLSGVAYTQTRLQITVMAATESEAENIALAIRNSLEGFSGLMAGALNVIGCRIDGYLPVPQEEIQQVHYHVDIIITHDS